MNVPFLLPMSSTSTCRPACRRRCCRLQRALALADQARVHRRQRLEGQRQLQVGAAADADLGDVVRELDAALGRAGCARHWRIDSGLGTTRNRTGIGSAATLSQVAALPRRSVRSMRARSAASSGTPSTSRPPALAAPRSHGRAAPAPRRGRASPPGSAGAAPAPRPPPAAPAGKSSRRRATKREREADLRAPRRRARPAPPARAPRRPTMPARRHDRGVGEAIVDRARVGRDQPRQLLGGALEVAGAAQDLGARPVRHRLHRVEAQRGARLVFGRRDAARAAPAPARWRRARRPARAPPRRASPAPSARRRAARAGAGARRRSARASA